MSYGAQVKIGIARQLNTGSYVSAAGSFHQFAFLSDDIGAEFSEVISENLIGRFEQGASYSGPQNVAGTLTFELTPRNIGAALLATINHSPSSVSSGSIRTLTFLPTTSDFDNTLVKAPFTVYKQFADSNSAELFYDTQFSQMQLTVAQGALTRGSVTVIGGKRLPTGIGSLAVVPVAADVTRHFPWNVASISWAGTGVSNMSELTISINDPIQPLYAINNSLEPSKFARSGFREITVNGTIYFNDRTLFNDTVTGTQRRLVVTLINTRASIQSGYYDTVQIDLPQVLLTELKPSVSGPGEQSVSFTGRATLDPTSNYAAQFIVVNTWTAGY